MIICSTLVDKSGRVFFYYRTRKRYEGRISLDKNRLLCLKRDNYVCQVCGGGKNLIVHHKDGLGHRQNKYSPNDDLSNLQTLCAKCHQKLMRNEDRREQVRQLRNKFPCFTLDKIANLCDPPITRERVRQILKSENLITKSSAAQEQTRIDICCDNCGKLFKQRLKYIIYKSSHVNLNTDKTQDHWFCSNECRLQWFRRYPYGRKRKTTISS